MNTRSSIQIAIEQENAKNRFKSALNTLVESYTVKGNVFTIDRAFRPVEIDEGYLEEEKVYDNLSDCIKEMKFGQAISINEDKFVLGNLKKQLSECVEDKKVFDIKYLQYIR